MAICVRRISARNADDWVWTVRWIRATGNYRTAAETFRSNRVQSPWNQNLNFAWHNNITKMKPITQWIRNVFECTHVCVCVYIYIYIYLPVNTPSVKIFGCRWSQWSDRVMTQMGVCAGHGIPPFAHFPRLATSTANSSATKSPRPRHVGSGKKIYIYLSIGTLGNTICRDN